MKAGITNQDSGITNRGAAWLVRLGALFVVSLLPLQHLFFDLWAKGAWASPSPLEYDWSITVVHSTYYRISWPGFLGGWVVLLAFVSPSLLSTFPVRRSRMERASLLAFLPLSAILAFIAPSVASPSLIFGRSPVSISSWVAALPSAAGAAGVSLAYVAGVARPVLAVFARRWLAAMILWVILLQWNGLGMSPLFFPGWVGAAGAAMILLGEVLAPRPRDS